MTEPSELPGEGRSPAWHVPLLCLLSLPLFFFGLGSYSVVNGDEGIYHTIAATMVETGDWTHLDYHGQHRLYDTFMNAPTQYWARAVLISIAGDSLWTMRLFSAVFGLLTVLGVYRLTVLLDPSPGRLGALFAALVQLTSFQFVYLHGARTGELDAVVCFLVVAIAIAFLRAIREGRSFAVHHVALAFLLTVKLPLAVVPVVAELALFAVTPRARPHLKRYVLSGFAIVPLGLVWHAFQALSLGEAFREVMGKMSGEAGGSVGGGEYTGGPLENLVWYARKALHGIHPWSVAFIPAALALGFARKDDDERTGWRFVALLGLCVVGFFLVVSKRFPWYVMPAYPLVAACVGTWLARTLRGRLLDVVLAGAVLAVALVAAPGEADAQPLVVRAARFPTEMPPIRGEEALPFAAILVLAFVVQLLAVRLREARWQVPATVLALLFGVAGARVLTPLRTLEHRSELAVLAERLEGRRLAGQSIAYPVAIPETEGWLRAQYHFGRHFVLVRRGNRIQLVGERPGVPPRPR